MGKDFAFQIVLIRKAVITPPGIEHPVSDVNKVQQAPEFLVGQFDLHGKSPVDDFLYYSTDFFDFQMEIVISEK